MDDKELGLSSSPSEQDGGRRGSEALHDNAAVLVYTTFPSLDDAKKAGRSLVEQGLAACVNVFPQMTSIFIWDGEVEEEGEIAMFVKTTRARSAAVLADIKRLHPYSVPARLVLPIIDGGEDFLSWISAQCTAKTAHS